MGRSSDPTQVRVQVAAVRVLSVTGRASYSAAVAAFWRVVLGINLLYELAMVFLLFQDLDSARSMMKYLDPNLGRPLPEKSYAENCDLTFENLWVSPGWQHCTFTPRAGA